MTALNDYIDCCFELIITECMIEYVGDVGYVDKKLKILDVINETDKTDNNIGRYRPALMYGLSLKLKRFIEKEAETFRIFNEADDALRCEFCNNNEKSIGAIENLALKRNVTIDSIERLIFDKKADKEIIKQINTTGCGYFNQYMRENNILCPGFSANLILVNYQEGELERKVQIMAELCNSYRNELIENSENKDKERFVYLIDSYMSQYDDGEDFTDFGVCLLDFLIYNELNRK